MLIYFGSRVLKRTEEKRKKPTKKSAGEFTFLSSFSFFFVGSLLVSSAFNCYSFTEEPQSGIVNFLLLLSMYCKNKNNNKKKKKKKKKHDEVLVVFE